MVVDMLEDLHVNNKLVMPLHGRTKVQLEKVMYGEIRVHLGEDEPTSNVPPPILS